MNSASSSTIFWLKPFLSFLTATCCLVTLFSPRQTSFVCRNSFFQADEIFQRNPCILYRPYGLLGLVNKAILEACRYYIMNVIVSVAQSHLVAVVIFQSFKKARLCGDHMVEFKVIEKNLN